MARPPLKRRFPISAATLAATAAVLASAATAPTASAGQYKNFTVAVYIPVNVTRALGDPKVLEADWKRLSAQCKIDKVYLENYRSHSFADDKTLDAVKDYLTQQGVTVYGGVTLAAGGSNGQFGTFDYEDPKDRAECQKAVEQAARHFNHVVLDDFFFYNTKSDADIAAKGTRSWSQYRLEKMREVAKDLVVDVAHKTNPDCKIIVKFPNWYEHFQGTGFDLEKEPTIFDGIYTGTETREAAITDQHLQAYESYEIIRYFNNIAPGRNGGGWVDTFDARYPDRYAEQLVDTVLAKAPEITLFSWTNVIRNAPVEGERPWKGQATSFDFDALKKAYHPPEGVPADVSYARVAGDALEKVDTILGALGKPIGIANYKPFHSDGEDFLQHYLGMVGLPIEMSPTFPTDADLVLLTESAKADPKIVDKIKGQLVAGKNVVITSGLLKALQGHGIEDVCELRYTDRKALLGNYMGGYGAGAFQALPADGPVTPVLFPEIRFYTNEAWQLVQAVSGDTGFPVLLMDRYSKGILYVLTIPDNQGDLYHIPQSALTTIKRHLMANFPVYLDAPAKVALFAYDNDTFVVQSYLPDATTVHVSAAPGTTTLKDLATGESIAPDPAPTSQPGRRNNGGNGGAPRRVTFTTTVPPHSYRAFAAAK